MREWLVIESAWKNAVFAPDAAKIPCGYIPRDVAEQLLKRNLDGTIWFTREESAAMRAHPDWRDELDQGCRVESMREWLLDLVCYMLGHNLDPKIHVERPCYDDTHGFTFYVRICRRCGAHLAISIEDAQRHRLEARDA